MFWILTRESNRLIAISWLQMHSHGSLIFLLIYVSNNTMKVEENEIWNKKYYGHYPRIIHFITTNNFSPGRS